MEEHRLALTQGYQIEHFRIESVLAKGSFGITYVAVDLPLEKKVAIKELLPESIAMRIDGSAVVPLSASLQESWEWARERFLDEAHVLAGFSHPAIVGVHQLIEANGTVYMVMDFVDGESYEDKLRRIDHEPGQASLMEVISPILRGLEEVHRAGVIHRDIKTENILINRHGHPVLIGFDSARSAVGETITMTRIVTHGYSPIEQYQTNGKIGPWTDIYALGAVMFRAITGQQPIGAADRVLEDEFQWLSCRQVAGFSEQFLQSVDWALRVRPEERPQQIASWEPHLLSKNAPVPELPLPAEITSSEVAEFEASHGVKYPEPMGLAREAGAARAEVALNRATMDAPYENSLRMKFVPVPGTDVLFSVWDTRVEDYAAFVSATSYDAGTKWRNPGFQQTSNDPVVDIQWDDAKSFCLWLTAKERVEGTISEAVAYRLPTDAEWSIAVGLPTEVGNTPREKDRVMEDVYPWGTQWPPPKGAGNYSSTLGASSFLNTSPVGSFAANRFGLYDMGGNVWQWCEDWYDGAEKYRVLRGGSWNCFKSERLLSSGRYHALPCDRFNTRGFRCVLATVLKAREKRKHRNA